MKQAINTLIYKPVKNYLLDHEPPCTTVNIQQTNRQKSTWITRQQFFHRHQVSGTRILRSVCRANSSWCALASNLRSVNNQQQQQRKGCARGSDASATHGYRTSHERSHTCTLRVCYRVRMQSCCTDVSLMSRLIDGTGLHCNRLLHSSAANVPLTRGNYSNKIVQLLVFDLNVTGGAMNRVLPGCARSPDKPYKLA